MARLAAVPRLLDQARANLNPALVPTEWMELALTACDGAQRFLANVPNSTPAQAAILAFADFLRRDFDLRGAFALGPELFQRLLSERHGLRMSADDVYAHGQDLSHALLSDLEQFGNWRQQIEDLKTEHPTPETLLQTYADETARARAFVESHALVSIPPGEQFEVRPTAPYLRATTPLGHFDRTPPFAPGDNLGILYITPIDPALPEARQHELVPVQRRLGAVLRRTDGTSRLLRHPWLTPVADSKTQCGVPCD